MLLGMVKVAPTVKVLLGESLVGTTDCAEVKAPTVIVVAPATMLTDAGTHGVTTVYTACALLLAPEIVTV